MLQCDYVICFGMSRTVRVDDDTYRRLAAHAGRLQKDRGEPVSINDAIRDLTEDEYNKISDLAGSWEISDEEYDEIVKSLREGWSRWKTS